MCDLTTSLGMLSQVFQSDNVTLSSMSDELDATLGYICQLQNSPGHNLTCFIQEFDNIENPTKFRDLSVSGGKKAVESAREGLSFSKWYSYLFRKALHIRQHSSRF